MCLNNRYFKTKTIQNMSFKVANFIYFLSFAISYFTINISFMDASALFSYLVVCNSYDKILFVGTFLSSSIQKMVTIHVFFACKYQDFGHFLKTKLPEEFSSRKKIFEVPDSYLVVLKPTNNTEKKYTWKNIGSFFFTLLLTIKLLSSHFKVLKTYLIYACHLRDV